MATLEHEAVRELGIRLSREQADRLEQAASATGQSAAEFATSALSHAVDAALASPPVTTLSGRDFDRFLALRDLETPPAPALVKVMEEYQRRLADGSLQVED